MTPAPSLLSLHRTSPWLWLYCDACKSSRAVAIIPFVIRWGDVSSDALRRNARCSRCGHRGASIVMPGWDGATNAPADFPSGQQG